MSNADIRDASMPSRTAMLPISGLLQRTCACGRAAGMTGDCEACSRKKRFALQSKLVVNAPGDSYEQEADRIADQVTAPSITSIARGLPPRIQRLSAEQSIGAAPASVDQTLSRAGAPLEPAFRGDMERRFGHDFSRVRVHTDAAAQQSARDVNAEAYTVGHNVVFGADRFAPGTSGGRRLIAHELTHVVQQGGNASALQRQPDKPKDKNKFDFMTADVEGVPTVVSIYSPSDPVDFLDAFEAKGQELINAQSTWLSNNMVDLVKDTVLKEKRNPFENIDVDTIRDVASRGYDKAVAALAAKGASEAGGALLKVLHFGKKVIIVGEKVGTKLKTFGGWLVWVGSALVQALIGPLFDKSKELVKQAVNQFAAAMKKVNEETIIPKTAESTAQFTKFMVSLRDYLLQDEDDDKPKAKTKSGSKGVSIGEGDYKMTIDVDTSLEFSEFRRDKLLVDLANVVLGIDNVVPTLKTDLSLYKDLAVKAGVFSGEAVEATIPGTDKPITPKYTETFRTKEMVAGKTKFKVSKGATVVVESEARYDTDADIEGMPKDVRPPDKYNIELYKVSTSWRKGDRPVGTTVKFDVQKTEYGGWYGLEEGEYYLVITKGGNPNFVLDGTVRIEIRPSGSGTKK
jgi:hypothetical protein